MSNCSSESHGGSDNLVEKVLFIVLKITKANDSSCFTKNSVADSVETIFTDISVKTFMNYTIHLLLM